MRYHNLVFTVFCLILLYFTFWVINKKWETFPIMVIKIKVMYSRYPLKNQFLFSEFSTFSSLSSNLTFITNIFNEVLLCLDMQILTVSPKVKEKTLTISYDIIMNDRASNKTYAKLVIVKTVKSMPNVINRLPIVFTLFDTLPSRAVGLLQTCLCSAC